jgi:beta-glucosidase/6-phospho-beta-glucosidase/beta-galactosidase
MCAVIFLLTLLDSFEWAQSYSSRFRLVEVDRKNLERRLKTGSHPGVRFSGKRG